MNIAKAFVGNVSVDLGGHNVFVTQEFLNGAKINSLFE